MNTSNPAAEAIDQLHPDIRPDDSTRKEHASAYHANPWDMFMDFGAADPARSSVDGTKNDQIRITLEMLDAELLEFSDQNLARLLGHELVNITYIAIWEFRDALEREPWRDMHPERLDCYVGAIAEWIK
ncbi:uncharacterized protein ASPGLDRAFT_32533 [Aspergillus glaucus CBS 516.65]|uniref:Uncharacterized protein n=1 Tax=Aspergillus glaucus CBS 516.65 TaxID=1160497 RepID=A0A1L9VW08_ASPGL|nr:hypothetical protein ASPGLDRAFT_32533 [Aspergillus glaucus CBS 516.65]OJJ88077.1 hypothetical protein ASPGLDRAFT_32533 [Aspergillus glaucus CBS 516.65]